ncbi:bifunctional diaminohydroxyphosphoribosylaminopyrimidine deaminase/5-amino-6-(5-phosphoribosylamino)uracil reductase RibD [Pseudalkalibacillus caeni]|uniref:Riboflavin biosynthesis protein RibD n=1 Tax=Exobacillus caeni TaxID=2574798 RepID=A0A5R9F2C5_9BACL|nr:bifunctional diaminohydroxyphosphoribosylaminopyrimidine deaminase/5-amino-6-(5-phosphoribosylamino)uracil reductase RibD [Pseudalkalibacillus caeni]TLS35648.1 bifunctional diaminohydroxyphosphoribosylaminopyrimidine deaminase/5-amino-6-(5-phosphoribosylamino)uracil reductase RibD [Pseudalkalibacillus caeni]
MDHAYYMNFAIDLAKRGIGQTSPNPAVGAVIVKGGEIVGFGAHLKAGEPHAEVHALNMAGGKAIGATMYVTLEPCSHFGKTPPCSNAIIDKKLHKVVIASVDPNPKVSGEGIRKLKKAGIEVITGVMEEEAKQLNEVFFHYMQYKRPFVTLKTATSLDGKIATATGESKWITGQTAREDSHFYRHHHDGILVGIGTVLADNPSLTTRLPAGGKNPVRIILDHELRTPLDARVVTDGQAATWIIVKASVPEEKRRRFINAGVEIMEFPGSEINVPELLYFLGEKGITSLLVEGGATIHGSFLRDRAVNQVLSYISPKVIGGEKAKPAFGGEGFAHLADALELKIKEVTQIGEDLKMVLVPKRGEETDVYRNS